MGRVRHWQRTQFERWNWLRIQCPLNRRRTAEEFYRLDQWIILQIVRTSVQITGVI